MARPIGKSGTQGLGKHHTAGCPNQTGTPVRCECPWRARYKGARVILSEWVGKPVNPRSKGDAVAVLNRIKTAVDNHTFDKSGERPVVEAPVGATLATFIDEWVTHHCEKHHLTGTGQPYMAGFLKRSVLGSMTLADLAGSSADIERWLDDTGKQRRWKPRTWNHYHQLLFTICDKATNLKTGGVPRMPGNPMTGIDRKRKAEIVSAEPLKDRRIFENVEDRLFEVVEQLNRPAYTPNRAAKLTREQAEDIRRQVASGTTQKDIAKAFGVSGATVSALVNGETWTDAKVGTRGTEMRRRLIGAFDAGLRAGEMCGVRLDYVQWNRPVPMVSPDGVKFNGYEVVLPATVTKGGKTTGKPETVLFATLRGSRMLEERRFALKRQNDPTRMYIFGTEDGRRVAGFKRGWRDLFALAGLDYGRDTGLVWHSTRHEFCSRIAENTKDPLACQAAARHKDLKTTQTYMHTRNERVWSAVAGLDRSKK